MKICRVVLFLSANFVATVAAYYRKCYEDFSLCLITNIEYDRWSRERRLSLASAANWCQRNSSSLAIITNETVQTAIAAFINDSSARLSSDVITSGYRYRPTDNFWTWTDGSRIQPSDINFNVNYNYAYIIVSKDGKAYVSFAYESTYKLQFICSFINQDSNCSDDHLQFERRCYKIHLKNVTWFGARKICIKEGSDLANFNYATISSFVSESGRYWIGLRREIWAWGTGRIHVEVKYSNWGVGSPGLYGGDCLCLMAMTSKWTNCDCSKEYRHICIQDYALASASTVSTSTRKIATSTTKVDDSSSQFRSTSTQTSDENSENNMSKDPLNASGFLPAVGIGIACLLILIIIIAVVAFHKIRRSSRSHDPGPSQGNFATKTIRNDDTPSTVYALVVPNANETEKTPNQTVYAELELAPKGKVSQRTSEPVPSHSGKATSQTVYEELDLVPREKSHGRAVRLPESEYANILHVDSVYANIAQTEL